MSGKGNLVKQVGEFKNLAPSIKAELPSYFAEKAALEIDFTQAEESEIKGEHADIKDGLVENAADVEDK